MRIRLAATGDAEAIRSIYNYEVANDTNTFDLVPRSPEEQLSLLASHQGAHPAIVAVGPPGGSELAGAEGEAVLGFGTLSPFRDRPAYATTVEDSLYVHPACRGAGVGRLLLEELVRMGARHGFHTMIARIVGHNEASIGLHRACGFELVGVEREVGRKHGRWLDVVELQLLL